MDSEQEISRGGGARGYKSAIVFPPRQFQKVCASEKTKRKIAYAFERILRTKSFEDVTVVDITHDCGISRQTFYNHFLDKYDLINWIYQQLLAATTQRIGIDFTWEQATRTKLFIMQENQEFYAKLFRVKGAGSLSSNEAQLVYDCYQANLLRLVGKQLNGLESHLLMVYCSGASYITAEWIRSGVKLPVEMLLVVDKIALPSFAQKVFLA